MTAEQSTCRNGHEVLAGQAFCAVCGAKIAPAAPMVRPFFKWLAGITGLFLVGLIVVGLIFGNRDDGEGSARDSSFEAFDVCKAFVKESLKSPGTAKFRNPNEDDGEVTVTGSGDGPYTVRSSVDSQNGFGALIRSNFVCEVTHISGDRWRKDALNIS